MSQDVVEIYQRLFQSVDSVGGAVYKIIQPNKETLEQLKSQM